jgi:hypothetical protein
MPNFIIHNEEYESGYLEGIQNNLMITSQSGFSGISLSSGMVRGDAEKETIFSGDITFNRRDPTGAANRNSERLDIRENIGVNIYYNTNKQIIPITDLTRSNFSNEEYSYSLGIKVAQAEMQYILNIAISAYVTATTKADASLVYINAGAFTKTDLIGLMRPLKDNASKIAGWLASTSLAFDVLSEATTQNRYGEAGVVYGASAGTFNIPMLSSALSSLQATGGEDYILALFKDAIDIKLDSKPPSIMIRDNDDTENHFQTWSMDGTFRLKLRNMPFIGATGNITDADLANQANWDKTCSVENLGGSLGMIG